jgi:hypothetical protein
VCPRVCRLRLHASVPWVLFACLSLLYVGGGASFPASAFEAENKSLFASVTDTERNERRPLVNQVLQNFWVINTYEGERQPPFDASPTSSKPVPCCREGGIVTGCIQNNYVCWSRDLERRGAVLLNHHSSSSLRYVCSTIQQKIRKLFRE